MLYQIGPVVFPAHAGMNRPHVEGYDERRCVPRPRGDEPYRLCEEHPDSGCSPPTRG